MKTLLNTELEVSSNAFKEGENIPFKYTCNGEDINPPITIKNIPSSCKSLALIMEDPDAPGGVFDHWLVWNIPVVNMIEEDSSPGIDGKNSFREVKYSGPCPPPGSTHRYFFKIYALNEKLNLRSGSSKKDLIQAIQGKVLASGNLMGKYHRS